MKYTVKEVFSTIQGEGFHAGRKAVFVRFAGCNMWDGNPDHREKGKGACAKWCDTDFFKGKKTDADTLEQTMRLTWGQPLEEGPDLRFCVLTGGEPAMQVDNELLGVLSIKAWTVAIETNGTIKLPHTSMWTTVSPKLRADGSYPRLANLMRVDELKVVLPGSTIVGQGWTNEKLYKLEKWARKRGCKHFFIMPQDPVVPDKVDVSLMRRNYDRTNGKLRGLLNASFKAYLMRCVDFVSANPQWRLGAQTHKMLNLP